MARNEQVYKQVLAQMQAIVARVRPKKRTTMQVVAECRRVRDGVAEEEYAAHYDETLPRHQRLRRWA